MYRPRFSKEAPYGQVTYVEAFGNEPLGGHECAARKDGTLSKLLA